ncbi:MAG TPA: deoxyguanosinetriphosphate triphosphohydrolase, partial [Clostridia bacterium]|nr:deoxyguanosinetriphosphate triphosphohydrolase [Clostridia bacterium]
FKHNVQSLRQVEKLENGTGLNLTFEVRDGIVNHKKSGHPSTLEGAAVSLADRIAYINHDIDDAVRAGVLNNEDLPETSVALLGDTHGKRINTMILDVLSVSFDKPYVRMSEAVDREFDVLRRFMFEKVYLNPVAKREEGKGMHVIEQLYLYYKNHMELLPEEFAKNIGEDGEERVAADYIACMTDRYAIKEYQRLFVPSEWQ